MLDLTRLRKPSLTWNEVSVVEILRSLLESTIESMLPQTNTNQRATIKDCMGDLLNAKN